MIDDSMNPDSSKVQSKAYEHEFVHPATAQWLKEHGYTFKHEFKTPVGRLDFLAEHDDGGFLIVECKADCDETLKALRQVLDYQRHLGQDHQCALAAPSWSIDEQTISACNARGIWLIGLDTPERKKTVTESPLWMKRLPFYEDILRRPQFILLEILTFHATRNTPPIRDIFEVYALAQKIVAQFNLARIQTFGPDTHLTNGSFAKDVYQAELNKIDDLPYQSLKELTENNTDFLESVFQEATALSHPLVNKYGLIPPSAATSIFWQAEKQAEFYAMAEMIHHFDYTGDGINELVFVDDFGNPVDDSLIWEGSANSFETAEEWDAWRKENRPSWFDQFDFLKPDKLGDVR